MFNGRKNLEQKRKSEKKLLCIVFYETRNVLININGYL